MGLSVDGSLGEVKDRAPYNANNDSCCKRTFEMDAKVKECACVSPLRKLSLQFFPSLPSAQPPARSTTREELDSKEVLKHARSQQAATAVRMRRSEEKEARILQQFTKTL